MRSQRIEQRARPDQVRQSVQRLSETLELDSAVTLGLEDFMAEKARGLCELAQALEGAEGRRDLVRMLAYYWVEVRLEWSRYNHIMNYQLVKSGEQDMLIVAKGAACTELLAWLEELMDVEDRATLADFCSGPLDLIEAEVESFLSGA